jgi:predicted Zn-ribbon and HTH transcriptional regulator
VAKKKHEPVQPPADEPSAKPIGRVPLLGCRCRCGHEWYPRDGEEPRVCPKCKSPNWDRPKLWTGKRPAKGE